MSTVMSFISIANAVFYPRYFWAGYSWGVGVIIHGLQAFDLVPFLNGDWERREVEKRLGRKLGT